MNLGFLAIQQEGNGYLGGYLITNLWGRPLEFRLSTAVQPNRVQQILYGATLQSYLCADLIGKTLVEKAGAPVQVLLTDSEAALDLRLALNLPLAWLSPSQEGGPGTLTWKGKSGSLGVHCHPQFFEDAVTFQALLDRLEGSLDLGEPFVRIREAMGEARKTGVTKAA